MIAFKGHQAGDLSGRRHFVQMLTGGGLSSPPPCRPFGDDA